MNARSLYLCVLLAAVLPTFRARGQQIIVRRHELPPANSKRGPVAEPKPSPTPAIPSTSVLHWNNGESIPGEPVGATVDGLVWKSPLFDDPLELAWTTLHRVDKEMPDNLPDESFAFVLRDGSRIYGDLTAVTATTVGVHGVRHGDVTLRRSEVLAAWRIKGNGLVYAGPLGESGWSPTQNVRIESENTTPVETLGKVPTRQTGLGGSLVLPFWHRTLTNAITLPDRAEIEVALHAKDQPEFQLVLDGRDKKRLRIETWGNEVVLATGKDFHKICQLAAGDLRVALRVLWDRPGKKCQVYGTDGTRLVEWIVPDASDGGKPAIFLMNKGRELTLDVLRVREWDGQVPTASDSAHPRVTLDSGRVVSGGASGLEDGTLTVAAPDGNPEVRVALSEVDSIVFSPDEPSQGTARATTLTCADGTFLHGQINGFADGRALLKTAFTESPLPVRIDDMRRLFVFAPVPAGSPPEPPLESLDQIVVQGTTLHGRMTAEADGTGPRWQPVGAKTSVAPAAAAVSEMIRAFPVGTQETPATSLLYTRTGDVLPGVLRGLDRKQVEFDSPWIETKTFPVDQLQAVQFDGAGKGPIAGFEGAGWEVLKTDKKTPRLTGDALKLAPNTVVGHPGAAQEGELRFTYDTENYSCLRLRLFCEGTNPARSLNYLLMRSGNRFSTGVETSEGQFNNQTQATTANGPVAVRLVIDEKSLRVYLNDALAEVVWYPSSRRAGAGLVLEASSMWGNPVQDVALSKFSARSPMGRSFLLSVNADAKAQALTIPRFRKDDPPRHALLANNGDVLRGEIVALTTTHIGFRIGLETLRIPRERVAAMIALHPPAAIAPDTIEPDATRKLLERRVGLRTWYGNVGYSSLLGILRQSIPELKFQMPTGQDNRRVQFHFEDQSVAEVLDNICELFELRYHVDKSVIVLEARAQNEGSNMVRKTYWLKYNPFEGHGSATDVLAARDVPFPKGASVEWQEGAQCLEIINTAANQEKIATLLANEFGGTLGSPSHWLLMRNGGRIGLTVEKFEPDFVQGTHPVYGRCKIPLADVYVVRNTLPEQTASARAVNGWRTVYAPEPELPQSGGENSELLGKDAPTFKLKTLDGGEFDLSRQKGSVVVLDFWATWCGPCIKSLPGLMEVIGQFPGDKVKLIGVDQAESPEQVKKFLESHKWSLTVAMDAGQTVGRQYGVDGIPHTVIIDQNGKVAWVHTGAAPDADAQVSEVVKKLLGGATEPARNLPKADSVLNGQPRPGIF